jgi:cytochrome c5
MKRPETMLMRKILFALGIFLNFSVAQSAAYPEFDEPDLKQGRGIWLGTCAACHANDLSDAPQAKKPSAWLPRIAKGRDVLYGHALKGFSGDYGDMPPRGGNSNLSDADVRVALEYMLKIVSISTGESQ